NRILHTARPPKGGTESPIKKAPPLPGPAACDLPSTSPTRTPAPSQPAPERPPPAATYFTPTPDTSAWQGEEHKGQTRDLPGHGRRCDRRAPLCLGRAGSARPLGQGERRERRRRPARAPHTSASRSLLHPRALQGPCRSERGDSR